MIPVVVRTTDDMLKLVPNSLREAAVALGCPTWKMITLVTYRAARAGIVTGVLLAVARISGETAPLLFTALNNQFWSTNMNAPMANLPVVIFQFAMSPYEDWHRLAWGGAALITLLVLALNIVARALFRKADEWKRPCSSHDRRPTIRTAMRERAPPADGDPPPKLQVRNLNFYYGGFHALQERQPRDPGEARSPPSSARRAAASRRCCAPSTACTSSIPSSAPKARS